MQVVWLYSENNVIDFYFLVSAHFPKRLGVCVIIPVYKQCEKKLPQGITGMLVISLIGAEIKQGFYAEELVLCW